MELNYASIVKPAYREWRPNPGQQTEVLSRSEFEILYGGARGGGKTDAGIVWISEPTNNPKYRGLVIRKNATDLGDWIDRAEEMYKLIGGKKVNSKLGTEFRFKSGAKIRTGHLKDENAYTKYQGHEYQRILIEELTLIPSEELYMKLVSSCRSTIDGLKPQILCTTNPGESGHIWVKERFVDIGPPNIPVAFKDEETGIIKWRIFIPARIEDNPILIKKDPGYVAWLNQLPSDLRKAWRSGDWSVYDVKGAYYASAMKDAEKEGRICHLPYEKHLPVGTAWDLGTTAIWFYQIIGLEIRFINYLEFDSLNIPIALQSISELGYIEYGQHMFPHDMEVKESSGRTRLQTFINAYQDIFQKVPDTKMNKRIPDVKDGITAVLQLMPRMRWDKEKCKRGVKALKNYRREWDEEHQTYKPFPLKDWASHGADGIRTFSEGYEEPVYYDPIREPAPIHRSPMLG